MKAVHLAATIAVLAGCAAGIGAIQPKLAHHVHKVNTAKGVNAARNDTLFAPPPQHLRLMTVGYKNMAADLLWANLVVEYGLHWQEKRAFPDLTRHIDGIIALEPDHPILYQFVDTMILYTPVGGGEQEARTARRYLEIGTKERPYDADLWLRYGQFLAFLAQSFLKDEDEINRWRVEGAHAIVHSVELGANAERALAALTILRQSGARNLVRQNVEKLYALTDDPELREQFLYKARQIGESTIAATAAAGVIEHQARSRYPFLSRSGVLLVGPHRSAALCAGPSSQARRECAPDWSAAIGER